MLFVRIRSIRDRIARLILQRDLRDLISSLAIIQVPKARMIGIELHDRIPIGNGFVRISGDRAHVDVIGEKLVVLSFCWTSCLWHVAKPFVLKLRSSEISIENGSIIGFP